MLPFYIHIDLFIRKKKIIRIQNTKYKNKQLDSFLYTLCFNILLGCTICIPVFVTQHLLFFFFSSILTILSTFFLMSSLFLTVHRIDNVETTL